MNFRSMFLTALGLGYAAQTVTSTQTPTTSLDVYRDLFSDLLPNMPPENREWWLREIQKGDVKKTTPLSKIEQTTKTGMFNKARATTNPSATSMIRIQYDTELEKAIVNYRNANNGSVFYSLKHNFPKLFTPRNVNLFGTHLMELPEFASFAAKNCSYWWHDTNNPGEKAENRIIRMRIEQRQFFAYRKCNTTAFNDFLSCITVVDSSPSDKSSFTNRYYVRFVDPSLTSYAVLRLQIPGAFTPNKQPAATWYYGCYTRKPKYDNDVPYEAGQRASACPPEYPVARGGLCARL